MSRTPGPWTVNGSHVYDADRNLIAQARSNSLVADLRLIAEAPTLLNLCQRIAADDGLNDLIQGIGEKPDWWDELSTAILKATGGAQ